MDFKKQPMVNWFAPLSLLRTGLETVLSTVFGRYADRREVQAALTQDADSYDYTDHDELWFDYVADLGDGFDSTFTVAKALAKTELSVDDQQLPRGRFLVMGGDQVYPSASAENYDNRLKGPYKHALPRPKEANEDSPHLYALPGNHDWYDGLTAFLRQFVQGRSIGGWRTQQQRSYFAIVLPGNCWLFAIDIQLDADLDWPQKNYFNHCIEQLDDKSRVIIASAVPSWIEEGLTGEQCAESLHYIESKIESQGARVVLNLAGDLHHYAHYACKNHRHRITCGGGGAFAHGTHHLPNELRLPENPGHHKNIDEQGNQATDYQLVNCFPEKNASLKTLAGNLVFAVKNKAMSATLGAYYLLYCLAIYFGSLRNQGSSWFEQLQSGALLSPLLSFHHYQSMTVLFLSVLMLIGLIAFYEPFPSRCQKCQTIQRWLLGGIHGLLHLSLAIMLMAWMLPYLYHLGISSFLLSLVMYWFVASIAGGTLLGLYLLVTNIIFKAHANAALSSNRIADYKSFLRVKVNDSGDIHVYAIGINKVIKRWFINEQGLYDTEELVDQRCHLIEKFVISHT